jgi:heterodisulfide reductase subunit A
MVRITINGLVAHVESQTDLIDAARGLGIHIPTLCHHDALKPYGACRLCMVEVVENGWSRLVTSCNYPAREGIEVFTESGPVKAARKIVLELLLARCPDVPAIRQMARKMGIEGTRFKKRGELRCILCGLCVRACEEMVGVSAISFSSRGTEREVSTPFGVESEACIGCGTCTYICPAGCIEMNLNPEEPGSATLRMGDLGLEPCPNNHRCESCDIDSGFMEEMRRVLAEVRSKS